MQEDEFAVMSKDKVDWQSVQELAELHWMQPLEQGEHIAAFEKVPAGQDGTH
jgi:hypothetical protein